MRPDPKSTTIRRMSQQTPQPYGQPYSQPYGQPYGPPVKYRPKARWFVIGAGLVLAAVLLFAGAWFTILRPLFHQDAVFAASHPHTM